MDGTSRGTFFPGVTNQQKTNVDNITRQNEVRRSIGGQVQLQKKVNQMKQNARYNSTDM